MKLWTSARNLMQQYNNLDYSDKKEPLKILDEFYWAHGENIRKLRLLFC
ncbi:MAG: hypothetical protein FWF54_09750 [Candidatus Azobacteroides sp.]|nr:hypothetical protein [Candidatus Azobacteroides sp.]